MTVTSASNSLHYVTGSTKPNYSGLSVNRTPVIRWPEKVWPNYSTVLPVEISITVLYYYYYYYYY